MFTIKVEKKNQEEDFDFENLGMFHEECCGGKIEPERYSFPDKFLFKLTCLRCKAERKVTEGTVRDIIKTSVDGEKREIKQVVIGCGKDSNLSFTVEQKS